MQKAPSFKSIQDLRHDTASITTPNADLRLESSDHPSNLGQISFSSVFAEYLNVCPTFLESLLGLMETRTVSQIDVEKLAYSAVPELSVSEECQEVRKRFPKLFQTQESMLGADDVRKAAIYYSMGILSTKVEKHEQALELYDRALRIMRNAGARTTWTADIIDSIGRMNVTLGKYNLGLQFFHEAKIIRLEIFGATHPKLADSEGSLGETYFEMGRFNSAAIHYREGLRICEGCFGREHLTTAQMMEDLARTYDLLGEKHAALSLYQDVLGIKLRLMGDHSETADTLHNMAITLQSLGSYDLALELFHKAVPMYQGKGKNDARKAANSFKNIAVVHSKQGNHAEAMSSLKQALKIEGREFGLNDPNTADTFNNLGIAYGNIGNHEEAVRLYEIALNIIKRFRPPTHPSIGDIHHNIGMARLAQGRGNEAAAREHFSSSHRNFLRAYGAEHVKSRKARELLESTMAPRTTTAIPRRNRNNLRRIRRFRRLCR
jgi:tetratricopeptide (TPR) repeat protein